MDSVELICGERFAYQVSYRANELWMVELATVSELEPYDSITQY